MESSEDKQWATKYLLDPLNAPSPSTETGPGTHFVAPKEEKKQPEATVHEIGSHPSPPDSVGRHRSVLSELTGESSSHYGRPSARQSSEIPTSSVRAASARTSTEGGHERRRGSSLSERYNGDESHRPLDIIRRESKRAHRSPHLRKDRHHGLDIIDRLGEIGDGFHHEGPYDAVSLARNSKSRGAPVAALLDSNMEALKATPEASISDSLRHHRPIDGVAQIPPGVPDRLTGKVYEYEEGTDVQRDGEKNYLNHWPGLVVGGTVPLAGYS
ncbi:MAG: hypothetical protein LQ340_002877 [Diploschistes diacapsis]|nr:MAG: hypothetical protein LQ340_002877 [Diploschistes diacapsis]